MGLTWTPQVSSFDNGGQVSALAYAPEVTQQWSGLTTAPDDFPLDLYVNRVCWAGGSINKWVAAGAGSAPVNKVLKADASSDEAFVDFQFAGAQTDIWITCRMAFTPEALAFWTGSISAYLIWVGNYLTANKGVLWVEGIGAPSPPEWNVHTSSAGVINPSVPPPTADGWHTFEFHYVDDGATRLKQLYIDGAFVGQHSASSTSGVTDFSVGLNFAGAGDPTDPANIAYFDAVTVGTARGDDDLFSDDFESGDLSSWTHVTGAVSVVDDPFGSSIATSPDGITWTAQLSNPFGAGGYAYDVAYSPELDLLVAVGQTADTQGDAIMTSPDGITWTGRGNPFITPGGAVSDLTEPDWATVTPPFADGTYHVNDVEVGWQWAPLTDPAPLANLVAGGYFWSRSPDSGTSGLIEPDWASGDVITDGSITWYRRGLVSEWAASTTFPFGDGAAEPVVVPSVGYATDPHYAFYDPPQGAGFGVAWSTSQMMFVAVGYATGGSSTVVATSPDGVTWTPQVTPFDPGFNESAYLEDVCRADGTINLWVAVGTNPDNTATVLTSPDAITWTAQTSPFDGNTAQCVYYSASRDLLIAGGLSNDFATTLATSPDGVAWTGQGAPTGSTINDITEVGDNLLYAAGYTTSTPVAATSPDGTTWTAEATPFDGQSVLGLAYDPAAGHMLAAGYTGTYAVGIRYDTPLVSRVLVASGLDADSNALTAFSNDGLTWNPNADNLNFSDLCWSPSLGIFLGTGAGAHAIWASRDGNVWEGLTNTGPWSDTSYCCAWSEEQEQFIVGAGFGPPIHAGNFAIFTSPDGITWTGRTSPFTYVLAVAYSPDLDLWVATGRSTSGTDAAVATSPDGVTWTHRPTALALGFQPANRASAVWLAEQSAFLVVGDLDIGTISGVVSSDGVTWTAAGAPLNATTQNLDAAVDLGGVAIVGGWSQTDPTPTILESTDGGASWTNDASPFDGATDGTYLCTSLVVAAELQLIVAGGVGPAASPGPTIATASLVPPTPPSEPTLAVPQARIHGPVFWKFAVCTRLGVPVSLITTLMADVEITFELNRPAMLSFTVPADDPSVYIPLDDGYPTLTVGRRVIKCYRKVSTGVFEDPGGWELVLVALCWSSQDVGDGSIVKTQFTCFDHLKVLEKRLVLDDGGLFNKVVTWDSTPGSQIIKDMIDRTNIVAQTGVVTTGTWVDTSDHSVGFNRAFILPSAVSLCDTGTVDLIPQYLDGTDGNFLKLGAKGRRGTDKSGDIVFGYGAPPRDAATLDRAQTLDKLANSITFWPNSVKNTPAFEQDTASQAELGFFEDAQVLVGINTLDHADKLAKEAIAFRRDPRDTVSVTPSPEISPLPLSDFDVGDEIGVNT